MVKVIVVEYEFSNLAGSICIRHRYQYSKEGKKRALKEFEDWIAYINWVQSEDYEKVQINYETTKNGTVMYKSWDTAFGLRNGNILEVYADG